MELNLDHLFDSLSRLFLAGDEEIAIFASEKLQEHRNTVCEKSDSALTEPYRFFRLLHRNDAHSCAPVVASVADHLPWRLAGDDNNKITGEAANRMITVELVGPNGIVEDASCRIGLIAQEPGVDYATRTHAAEELFVIIAGHADWQQSGSHYVRKKSAARIHHGSMEPHANRTTDSALVCAWAWSGDVSYQSYQYSGGK